MRSILVVWVLLLFTVAAIEIITNIYQSSARPDEATARSRNPYTAEALSNNPHLGWQPPPDNISLSFSWRDCFGKAHAANRPPECRESASELGEAPEVDEGWIPDVAITRKMLMYGEDLNGNAFPPPLDDELCENIAADGGYEGDANKACFLGANVRSLGDLSANTVKIAVKENHTASNATNHSESIEEGQILVEVPAPKIMCIIYTMETSHANRIRAIRETWAGGCDGFLAFSTKSDPRLPAISIPHEGPEEYHNIWQKVRSIWKYVAKNYMGDFEWFIIGGDDIFILPYNLKTYLASLAHKDGADPKAKEYYVGKWLQRSHTQWRDYFNSGGAGYVLSQATLRKLNTSLDDAEHCHAHDKNSMEDVLVARCLRHLGIHQTDTRDSSGRDHFHDWPPSTLFRGQLPAHYLEFNREWGMKGGKNCCAPGSVSFHNIKEASMMRHLHALLQFCGNDR